jgi:hypothetical protein
MKETKTIEEIEQVKFDPASLSQEDLEAAVEYYLGLHPKYFIYNTTSEGPIIAVDGHQIMMQGVPFRMFKPHAKELGIEL